MPCIYLCYSIVMSVYGICWVSLLAKGNWFSLCTLREKYSPVFSRVFLNCKKTSFAKDTIVSQSFILTLLREKVNLEF